MFVRSFTEVRFSTVPFYSFPPRVPIEKERSFKSSTISEGQIEVCDFGVSEKLIDLWLCSLELARALFRLFLFFYFFISKLNLVHLFGVQHLNNLTDLLENHSAATIEKSTFE